MKNIRLLSSCILMAALAACTTPPPAAPHAAAPSAPAKPTAEWLANAQLIKTKRFTIYYEGTARGTYTTDLGDWNGTVTGRVYMLEANGSRYNIPKGTLICKDGGVKILGEHTANIIFP